MEGWKGQKESQSQMKHLAAMMALVVSTAIPLISLIQVNVVFTRGRVRHLYVPCSAVLMHTALYCTTLHCTARRVAHLPSVLAFNFEITSGRCYEAHDFPRSPPTPNPSILNPQPLTSFFILSDSNSDIRPDLGQLLR